MLSIAKLRVGQEAYQLSGVAQSLDDYYTGVGEAAGRWLGAGAERLGLSGDVAPDDLRAVLAGLAPGSGGLTPDGATVRTHARRVPGFDVTLKAPKSVSVLYAVSDDPRVQGAIIEAGEAAMRETLSWLEREAIRVRRGSGDVGYLNDLAARDPEAADAARQRMLPGRGVVAASFRHRTSRSGDPLLHWHTLVANMVEGPDGRWGAFVHPELYRAARAAGEVFQTVLRGELTGRLGLEWRPGRHVLEVAGVPQALCDQFSKRSVEIDAWLASTGTPDDPAGRQEAVLATRRGKPEVEGERFDAQWKAEATAAGWGPDAAEALIASTTQRRVPGVAEVWRLPVHDDRTGVVTDRTVDPEEWIADLGRAVTKHDSTFTRPELVQAVAALIGEGATAATLDRMVARVLASEQVVPISDGPTGRWTTVELMGVERRFLSTAETTRGTRRPVAAVDVDRALTGFVSLGADQEQAVRTLTATSDAVSVMVGPAGTGKTYTLDAVRHVFQAAGYDVVGVAPSARAAHELHADAHIESSTIHRMLGSWSRGYDLPHARTVLVVDEAGMAAIRDLEQIVPRVVAAGGRVILVGDHHQLPEVAAGGGFAALATDPAATMAELTVNRRQHHAWERDALAELRDGHVAAAVSAYRDHDRVVVVADRAATVDAGVERWLDAHRDGHIPVLLAGTNETVDALNTAVRRQLLDLGVLGPVIEGSGGSLAIGERLMIRVNDYQARTTTGERTAVLNGQTGTLTGRCDAGLIARMDHDHTDVILTHDHLSHGVGYAYASTAHKAQGGTWDLAITVGVDGLYREAGYLVMSRGRASNWLIVTAPELDALDRELGRHDSPIPLPGEEPDSVDEELVGRLNVSRRKLLAVTRDPHAEAIQHATTHLDLTTLEGWAAHARAVEEQASRIVGGDPDRTRDRLARTDHAARHAAVGHQVKAWDRRNIGTITALDDDNGAVAVTFTAADGRTTTKTIGWGDVSIVQPRQPAARTLSPAAADVLDQLTTAARLRLTRWDAHLAAHGVQPGDRHVYEHAARLAIDRAGALLAAAQPDWLTTLLGQRPTDRPAAVQVWDDAIRDLAGYRARHGITDPRIATGPDTDPSGRVVWAAVSSTMAAARVWLDTYTTSPALPPVRTRSAAELHARRAELDAVFADAPADHRQLIDRLRDGGMLPLEDTAELLGDVLVAQGERRRWILEHWPHVVEYAEITHTLSNGLAGPDVAPLVDTLAASTPPHLAAAATEGESWLVTLTAGLVPTDATTIDAAAEQLLADVAGYRHRWAVTGPLPLGDAATDVDQANERALLAIAIDHAIGEESIALEDPWDIDRLDPARHSRLPALDDTLGR
ncbi:MAG: MobF family relaxase [Acidimicrobiia bacterium]